MSELRDENYSGAIQIAFDSENTINGGSSSNEKWEGTLEQVRLQKVLCAARGASKNVISPKGDGAYVLTASWSFDVDPDNPHSDGGYVDTLELEINATQRSVYQSPVYRSWFSDFDEITHHSDRAIFTLAIVGDCSRKYLAGQPARNKDDHKFHYTSIAGVETLYDTMDEAIEAELNDRLNDFDPSDALNDQELNAALDLFEAVAKMGVTSFIEYDTVFRRTVTAGHPTAIQANNTGSGKIWTSAEVISFEGIADDIANGFFSLPPDAQWHKDKPRVQAAYGQKTQISYSYTQIKTASALLYEAYGSAELIHDQDP